MMKFKRGKKSTPTTGETAEPGSTAAAVDGHLQVLGLAPDATWDEIRTAHRRLVADLTPGPDANHRNVALANRLLAEVNRAFDSLRSSVSVAS